MGYYSLEVRKTFAARALIVCLCVALLSFLFLTPAGQHVAMLLVPLLIFVTTLPRLAANLPRKSRVRSQPISFLSLDSSRAPPAA